MQARRPVWLRPSTHYTHTPAHLTQQHKFNGYDWEADALSYAGTRHDKIRKKRRQKTGGIVMIDGLILPAHSQDTD